jgi:hypothetical protein
MASIRRDGWSELTPFWDRGTRSSQTEIYGAAAHARTACLIFQRGCVRTAAAPARPPPVRPRTHTSTRI